MNKFKKYYRKSPNTKLSIPIHVSTKPDMRYKINVNYKDTRTKYPCLDKVQLVVHVYTIFDSIRLHGVFPYIL